MLYMVFVIKRKIIRKNDPAKDRKALATYVELKGYKHGEIGNGRKKKDHNGLSTLDEIAKELNMSTTNLKRALRIERNLTDSMKELLDTGKITKTFASDTIASLSEEEVVFYWLIKSEYGILSIMVTGNSHSTSILGFLPLMPFQ